MSLIKEFEYRDKNGYLNTSTIEMYESQDEIERNCIICGKLKDEFIGLMNTKESENCGVIDREDAVLEVCFDCWKQIAQGIPSN